MFKKFLVSFLVVFSFVNSTFGNIPFEENPTQYRRRGNFNHWFFSANIGGQAYFGDHDKQESVFKRIVPKYELSLGKWFDPSFGFRLSANAGKIRGLAQTLTLASKPNMEIGRPHWLYRHEFNYVNIHADILFNWSNDVETRYRELSYQIIPYVGIGFTKTWDKPSSTYFTPNLGVIQTYKLNDKFDANLDVRGNLYGDGFDGERGGNRFEGKASITVGLTYNLKY